MKEFSFQFDEIFSGLDPKLRPSHKQPSCLDCHNLVPVADKDYTLHEVITDLNATGVSWGGFGSFYSDEWIDHDTDVFEDDDDDKFLDS